MSREFRIADNAADRGNAPLVLIDDSNTVVRIGDRAQVLADIAFCELGADAVIHEHNYGERETIE